MHSSSREIKYSWEDGLPFVGVQARFCHGGCFDVNFILCCSLQRQSFCRYSLYSPCGPANNVSTVLIRGCSQDEKIQVIVLGLTFQLCQLQCSRLFWRHTEAYLPGNDLD